jgi:hypothetical protein
MGVCRERDFGCNKDRQRREGISGVCLTFDVRGGPPAGRPLDGVVRRTRLSKGMTGTRYRYC